MARQPNARIVQIVPPAIVRIVPQETVPRVDPAAAGPADVVQVGREAPAE
jgi:hypothetical protein